MKALIQRVKSADVKVNGEVVGNIKKGLLVFLGIKNGDMEKDVDFLVNKISKLRVFDGEKAGFDKSLLDLNIEILVVSQFTLYGSCKKGLRPDFGDAAKPEIAKRIYELFLKKMRKTGLKVETGIFQAMMDVTLVNDGPVTFMIES